MALHDEQITGMKRSGTGRPVIPLRDWSAAQRALRAHRITLAEIAARSGATEATVCRALNRQGFASVQYGSVARMRAAAEDLLVERGFDGELATLWEDYDRLLFPEPNPEPEPPRAA